MTMVRNYYCSQKFDWVEIRLFDGFVSSCCQATPHRLKKKDIEGAPIGFFNYPEIQQERQMMLSNHRVPGCESCWKFEDLGLPSRRLLEGTTDRKYENLAAAPRIMNLVLSNTCNQTCVYCCKNYSNSWLNDVINNGDYVGLDVSGDRYSGTQKDHVMYALSQKDLEQSSIGETIMSQIKDCQDLDEVIITGGEPFLDNALVKILDSISHAKRITIFSGLTVNHARMIRICDQIQELQHPDVNIKLSAENIGPLHEFNRYGSKHDLWLKNYALIADRFEHRFWSVVSNVTLFGLPDFLETFPLDRIGFNFLTDPPFLMSKQMDRSSKRNIIQRLNHIDHPSVTGIINHIDQEPDTAQIGNLKRFFFEFARRRSLDTAIFPRSFLEWMTEQH